MQSVLEAPCDMRFSVIFFFLVFPVFPKGCLCGKKKGVCNYEPAHGRSTKDMIVYPSYYRIYGYIHSEAPYRNPFYHHFGESLNCTSILIVDVQFIREKIYMKFICGDHAILSRSSKTIMVQPDQTERFAYTPFDVDHNCREWKAIDRYHTDYDNYFIMFGCENSDDNSHFIGLWVLIRSRSTKVEQSKIENYIEEKIIRDVHRIIDIEYSDIKNDIIFVPNYTNLNLSSCGCREERIFENLDEDTERLDTCVKIEKKEKNLAMNLILIICILSVIIAITQCVF